ncbi:alpha/beta hydrolase [Sesbania bispinosa]|nr:alpha/beta hydrolase [Sesbania bispinosa]
MGHQVHERRPKPTTLQVLRMVLLVFNANQQAAAVMEPELQKINAQTESIRNNN